MTHRQAQEYLGKLTPEERRVIRELLDALQSAEGKDEQNGRIWETGKQHNDHR